MRLFFLFLLTIITSSSIFAQECLVLVEQQLVSECDRKRKSSSFPRIDEMYVYYNQDESKKERGSYDRVVDYNKDKKFYYWTSTLLLDAVPTSVTVETHIGKFGNKSPRTRTDNVVFSPAIIGKQNKYGERLKKSCVGNAHDHITLNTTLTIDPVVVINSTSDNKSHLVIEKDEKLLLTVGEYYNGVDPNPKLQVSINGINKDDLKDKTYETDDGKLWFNLDCKIDSKGKLSLSYEDIVGKYILLPIF